GPAPRRPTGGLGRAARGRGRRAAGAFRAALRAGGGTRAGWRILDARGPERGPRDLARGRARRIDLRAAAAQRAPTARGGTPSVRDASGNACPATAPRRRTAPCAACSYQFSAAHPVRVLAALPSHP